MIALVWSGWFSKNKPSFAHMKRNEGRIQGPKVSNSICGAICGSYLLMT